jgi:hypothetical protein
VNLFWQRLTFALGEEAEDKQGIDPKTGTNPLHSFKLLRSKGIDLVRFAASPYCPSHLALWRLGGKGEELYWRTLDGIIHDAAKAHVRLIPTLQWRATLPSISCGEDLSLLFQTEKLSCARILLHLYSSAVVSRYRNANHIVAWELMNELNLGVDVLHKARKFHRHSHHNDLLVPQRGVSDSPVNEHQYRRLTSKGCYYDLHARTRGTTLTFHFLSHI